MPIFKTDGAKAAYAASKARRGAFCGQPAAPPGRRPRPHVTIGPLASVSAFPES